MFNSIAYAKNHLEILEFSNQIKRAMELVLEMKDENPENQILFFSLKQIVSDEVPLEMKRGPMKFLALFTYCLKVKTPNFDGLSVATNPYFKDNLFSK